MKKNINIVDFVWHIDYATYKYDFYSEAVVVKKKKADNTEENRDDRFKRVAAKRTNDIIHKIRLLGNCSNRSSYNYDEDQITKIFFALDRELKAAKARFSYIKLKREFRL